MASSSMVIKVKYGDTLRRFNAPVDENGQLDLDMGGLRFKIFGLFSFQLDEGITMTYVDEDGDVVTLVDDEDLRDAMKQNMKFLRIDVDKKSEKKAEKSDDRSTGSSTPVGHPVPDIRELISKFPRELASNGIGPGLTELVDSFAKIGLPYLLQAGGVSGVKNDYSQKPAAPSANPVKDDGKSEVILKSPSKELSNSRGKDVQNVAKDVEMSLPSQTAPVDLNVRPVDSAPSTHIGFPPVAASLHTAEARKDADNGSSGELKGKSLGPGGSTSSSIFPGNVNECPFSGTPIGTNPAPAGCRRHHGFKRMHSEASGGIFHTGVQCDGCGSHPIVGPRFKSTVKEDYDLCRICFSSMGDVSEYIRIDHPVSYRHPRSFRGMHEHHPWKGPPVLSKISRVLAPAWKDSGVKHGRYKLDSRFVLDVNVLDGTLMSPSTPFTKIWRMRNNGGLIWPKGTQLMWIGGDRFCKSDAVELEIPAHGVSAQNELDIAVDFIAPESPGRYISYWRMASPSGQKFGQRVWVLIQVDAQQKDFYESAIYESFQGLNLNLPPVDMYNFPLQYVGSDFDEPSSSSAVREQVIPVPNKQPPVSPLQYAGSAFAEPFNSGAVREQAIPVPYKQPENDQDLNFPINNSLLVGQGAPFPTAPVTSSTVSYPTVEPSAPTPTVEVNSSTVSYPTVDIYEAAPTHESSPVVAAPTLPEATSSENAVEDNLLKELEEMGFKQVDLNKEVLHRNEYNLEQSVDDLCDVPEWDPILEELQEMGFMDAEMNKKLLAKNNGSIKRVVMDLIKGDKA